MGDEAEFSASFFCIAGIIYKKCGIKEQNVR